MQTCRAVDESAVLRKPRGRRAGDRSASGRPPVLDGRLTPARARGVALIVAAAFFMEYLDGTVIATALPAMAHDFGRPAVTLSIGISAYLLALAVFIPLSGWVADRLGTRDVFTAAIAVFTAASML